MRVSIGTWISEFLNDRHLGHRGTPSTNVSKRIGIPYNAMVRFPEGIDPLASSVKTSKLMSEIIGLAPGIAKISDLKSFA